MKKVVFLSSEEYFVFFAVSVVLIFVFNIEYPKKATATMEFMQR